MKLNFLLKSGLLSTLTFVSDLTGFRRNDWLALRHRGGHDGADDGGLGGLVLLELALAPAVAGRLLPEESALPVSLFPTKLLQPVGLLGLLALGDDELAADLRLVLLVVAGEHRGHGGLGRRVLLGGLGGGDVLPGVVPRNTGERE